MPTYDFKCQDCGNIFEKFQTMNAPIPACPECSSSKIEKLISRGGGMIFKGSGFYLTDYKNANQTPAKTTQKTEAKKETHVHSASCKH
ncbi:zinc ribbon domain-containing protein [bacterium]|nr:zinc ribbon domain-containing protein [bacterium]